MALTEQQLSEMVQGERAERMAGRPEVAAEIRLAINAGEVYADIVAAKERTPLKQPPTAGPGSKKTEWDKFAMAESDIDTEIILSSTKIDLVKMLKAYGVIE